METIGNILLFIFEHPFLSFLIFIIILVLLCSLLEFLLNSSVDKTTDKINSKFNTNIDNHEARGVVNSILKYLFR